jgi:hypothetical protein
MTRGKKKVFVILILTSIVLIIRNTNSVENDIKGKYSLCDPFAKNNERMTISEYPKIRPLYEQRNYNFQCLNKEKKRNIILFWHKIWDDFDWSKNLVDLKCPVYNCQITKNRMLMPISTMVLFYMPTLYQNSGEKLPRKLRDQKFVFTSYEAPTHYSNFSRFNGLFDLSATYRLDSDFSSIYFTEHYELNWELNEKFNDTQDFHLNKLSSAAIIVSNCGPYDKSNRFEYIKALNKTIPIVVFGKCGIPCPNDINCRQYVSQNFMFYLSFENSLCRDYITEKFFDINQQFFLSVFQSSTDWTDENFII